MSILTTQPLKAWPSAANGINMVAGTLGVFGDWYEIVASADQNSQVAGFMAGMSQLTTTGVDHLEIQLGTGSDGNEVPFGNFLIVNNGSVNTGLEVLMLPVPVDLVPAGSRLVARIKSEFTSTPFSLAVMYYENTDSTVITTGTYNYAPYGTNLGAAINPNPAPWGTSSSWVELVNSLPEPSALVGVAIQPAPNAMNGMEWEIDLAIGDPGSEVYITTVRNNIPSADQGISNTNLAALYPVQSGTRVSARMRKNGTSTVPVRMYLIYISGVVLNPPAVVFENAKITIGLTWIEVIMRSGGFHVWSDRPLPDPIGYYGGWKEARVIKWDKFTRQLSNRWDGQYTLPTATITLTDWDRTIRQLDNDNELLGATFVVRMIDDDGRRALKTPRVVCRGTIRDIKPTASLQYELTLKDIFAAIFDANGSDTQLPNRLFNTNDFHNCTKDLIRCSANDYLVNGAITMGSASGYNSNGGASLGASSMNINNGKGTFTAGHKFALDKDRSTVYTVTSSSGSDPETSVSFTPVLAVKVDDNDLLLCGDQVMFVDSGYGVWASGTQFNFGGHATTYTTSKPSYQDPEKVVVFTPALTANVADDETVLAREHFKVPVIAANRVVPFAYGYITDRFINSDGDNGDGQGVPTYVGDRLLADGKVYGEFVWVGHACYSSTPIDMVYFWNGPLDGPGTVWYSNISIPVVGIDTEADIGGRIALPGYGNWSALGYGSSFIDYNGHRYTTMFMRGIFRDWALGIIPAPDGLGGVPFDVSAYGAATGGDGSGTLITRIYQQYLHILQNWCPPVGAGYQSGAWLPSPTFVDDPTVTMIDENSFSVADAQSQVYVTSGTGGFRGDFVVGANNEAITFRTLISRLNVSCGGRSGSNTVSQFMVTLLNTSLATTTMADELSWVRDIFSGSWEIDPDVSSLYTSINNQSTQDYVGRQQSGWRSDLKGMPQDISAAAESVYGARTQSPMVSFYMVRERNRSIDVVDYIQGSDTVAAILRLKHLTNSFMPRVPKLQTGPAGFNYELGQILPLTHYEGLTTGGWIRNPAQIELMSIDPTTYTTYIESFNLGKILT